MLQLYTPMGYCQRKKYQRANFFIERNAGGSERAGSKPYTEAEYAHDKRRFRARERRVLEFGGIACAEPNQPFAQAASGPIGGAA